MCSEEPTKRIRRRNPKNPKHKPKPVGVVANGKNHQKVINILRKQIEQKFDEVWAEHEDTNESFKNLNSIIGSVIKATEETRHTSGFVLSLFHDLGLVTKIEVIPEGKVDPNAPTMPKKWKYDANPKAIEKLKKLLS